MTGSPERGVEAAVERFLQGFERPAKLLVATSGGSDSTGLLLALHHALASGLFPGLSLAACTIDHALRAGSRAEALSVGGLCARLGVPHTIRTWEGAKPDSGLQAAARAARYRLLAEAARAAGASAVVTGHTADDQRETIAMRALRSDDGAGLAGMAEAVLVERAAWVLRPFLPIERAAIRAYLQGLGEGWIDDPSNDNVRFERVRLRREEGGAAAGAAGGAAERRADAEAGARFLGDHVAVHYGVVGAMGAEAIPMALAEVSAWRALLLLAATLGGRTFPPDRAGAERLRAFLASGKLSRMTAGGVVFDRRSGGLYLYREDRGIGEVTVPPGAEADWDGRFRVSNPGTAALTVRAQAAGIPAGFAALPTGVARRALKAVPCVLGRKDGETATDAAIAPILAPYDRFLPRFDLPLADALAALLGLPAFSCPPNE